MEEARQIIEKKQRHILHQKVVNIVLITRGMIALVVGNYRILNNWIFVKKPEKNNRYDRKFL